MGIAYSSEKMDTTGTPSSDHQHCAKVVVVDYVGTSSHFREAQSTQCPTSEQCARYRASDLALVKSSSAHAVGEVPALPVGLQPGRTCRLFVVCQCFGMMQNFQRRFGEGNPLVKAGFVELSEPN